MQKIRASEPRIRQTRVIDGAAYFVLYMFLGMLYLDASIRLFLPDMETAHEPQFCLRFVLCLLFNGALTAGTAGLYYLLRGKRPAAAPTVFAPVWTTAIAFIAGTAALPVFLRPAGLVALTGVALAVCMVHISRFGRKIVPILKPGRYATWGDMRELLTIFAILIVSYSLVITSIGIIHYYVPDWGPAFSLSMENPNAGFIDVVYFTVVVMTTLGFGDIVPLTPDAKIVVAAQCLTSYIMFATLIGILTRGITHEKNCPTPPGSATERKEQ